MWHRHFHLQRNHWLAVLLLLGATLATIATLLVCILHCHLVLGDSHSPPTHVLVAGQRIMICHTPGDSSAPVPVPVDFTTLQSITSVVPVALALLGAVWLLLLWLALPAAVRPLLVVCVPEPPPPRAAALLI